VVKEYETCAACQVPSQSKSIANNSSFHIRKVKFCADEIMYDQTHI